MQSGKTTSLFLAACLCLLFSCSTARPEEDWNQPCQNCHLPHPARLTNEIHPRVDCAGCHLEKGILSHDLSTGWIRFKKNQEWTRNEDPHDNLKGVSDRQSCRECHFKGNQFGASALVLPPKGVLCLPCHTATFSTRHPLTIIALIIFSLGTLNLIFIWQRSSGVSKIKRNRYKIHPFIKMFIFTRSLLTALIINQRLFRQSPGRWLIHGLIIYPLIMRFLWGLTALLGSLYFPQWKVIWPMLDRHYPATALFFDLTGVLILCGFVLALFRHGIGQKSALSDKLTGIPRMDWIGFLLLGSLIISGFLLEAFRLAMSANNGTPYAFAGYLLSRMLHGSADMTLIHSYFWYTHFILVVGLVAYLPFSRLKHILVGPISIAIQSVHEHENKNRRNAQEN